MPRPDFSLLWGSTRPGGITPIDPANYSIGWQYRAGEPPITMNFDYYQNLTDQRNIWLSEQLPVNGTTALTKTLLEKATASEFLDDLNFSTIGKQLAFSANTSSAQDAIGATSKGKELINAANTSAAQSAIGATLSAIKTFLNSTSTANARSAIGVTSAGTSTEGLSRIATSAEVNDGLTSLAHVTPATLKAGFDINLAQNGYIKLPNHMGGLIIQWARVTVPDDSTTTLVYPIPFLHAVFVGLGTHAQSFDVHEDAGIGIYNRTLTQATIRNGSNGSGSSSIIDIVMIGH